MGQRFGGDVGGTGSFHADDICQGPFVMFADTGGTPYRISLDLPNVVDFSDPTPVALTPPRLVPNIELPRWFTVLPRLR